jgi:hypothetical protein
MSHITTTRACTEISNLKKGIGYTFIHSKGKVLNFKKNTSFFILFINIARLNFSY